MKPVTAAVQPIVPHSEALAAFIDAVAGVYDLTDDQAASLSQTVEGAVNIAALNALTSRPKQRTKVERKGIDLSQAPELVTPQDVSAYTGIPESTLSQMRQKGEGPAWSRRGERRIVYPRDAVIEWAAKIARENGTTVHVVPQCGAEPFKVDAMGRVNGASNDPSEARDAS